MVCQLMRKILIIEVFITNTKMERCVKTKKSNIAVRLNFAPLQGLEPWTL